MGCSWCSITEDNINDSNFGKLKNNFKEEYKEYLLFLNKLKSDLNSSIYKDNESNNNSQANNTIVKSKEFIIVPRNWFQNWEKRLEYAIQNDKYKPYDKNFEYKDMDNKAKFYYEFITKEIWAKICKNSLYKIKNQYKQKVGLICNNLIIFQYNQKYNNIEIFFFQNDDDLFFTNLLFSFENCHDEQKECISLLKILKKSPIQEIFGNMHYDYSNPKFEEQNKKIIIYNKTSKIAEQIKIFRKTQYNSLFLSNENKEGDKSGKETDHEKFIENYYEKAKDNKYYNNFGSHQIIYRKGEGSLTGNALSRASTIMLANQQKYTKFPNNVTSIKIYKQKELNDSNNDDIKEINDNNFNTNLFSSAIKNEHVLFQNKFENQKNLLRNRNIEISNIINNTNKDNNFRLNTEEDINENFFQCILYCLFNIKELTNYMTNNIDKYIKENSFSYIYSKTLEYFNSRNNNNKIKDIYNLSDSEKKLIKNCPEYDFQSLINLTIFQNSDNIISNIINCLDQELNKSNGKESIKNKISDENIYLNEEEKNNKYNEYIKEFEENNKSIIFDLFYGIKEKKLTCINCNKSKYKYEIINVLYFPKEKFTKFNQNENKLNFSIDDLLNYYNKEEKQQLLDCPDCHRNTNYSIIYDICKYPKVFILYLNLNNTYNEEKETNLKINISGQICLLKDKYELIGVISLKNKKNNNENDIFISYLHSITEEKWIICEENKISEINSVYNLENLNPIVLFYQRI